MLHFYGWATPNSQRVSIMLEECGLDLRVTGVNIRAREQFAPEILALNPYGKIPILVEEALARAGASKAAPSCCTWRNAHGVLPASGGGRGRRRCPG
jgi:hypothetical protein